MNCVKSVTIKANLTGKELTEAIRQAQVIDTFKVCGLDLTKDECNWLVGLHDNKADLPLFSRKVSDGYLRHCFREKCPYYGDGLPNRPGDTRWHEHWDINTYYVADTTEGVVALGYIIEQAEKALKAKIMYLKIGEYYTPLKTLAELARIWRESTIELGLFKDERNVKGIGQDGSVVLYKQQGITFTTDDGHNVCRLYTQLEGGDIKTGVWPWNSSELVITGIKPAMADIKIKETKPMKHETPDTQVPETQEKPQNRTLEPFDPIKADAAAKDFQADLAAILNDGNRASDLCTLFSRYYLKAGHKRLGRVLVTIAKGGK